MKTTQMKELMKEVTTKIIDKEFRMRKTYSRPVFIFWGPAGVGKTYSAKQAGNELNLPVINIRLGQEMAEDMSYPEVVNGVLKKIIAEMWPRYSSNSTGNKIPRQKNVDGQIITIENEYQIDFNSIKKYIENYDQIEAFYTNQGLSVNDAPGGLLFLDEINRIEDKGLFQMIFQLFESGTFKGFTLPEEMALFGACNPDNEDYITSPWFDDKAFANRCIHLSVKFDQEVSKSILRKGGYSEESLTFFDLQPGLLFDEKSNTFDIPKVDYSLRNASFFDTYVMGIKWAETQFPETVYEIIGSIYGSNFVGTYQQVIDNTAKKTISPEEILKSYDEYKPGKSLVDDSGFITYPDFLKSENTQTAKSKARVEMIANIKDNRTDYVQRSREDMVAYIIANIDNKEFQENFSKNALRFVRFALDLGKSEYAIMFNELNDDNSFPELHSKEENICFVTLICEDSNNKNLAAVVNLLVMVNDAITID
jgi:hypothetical protein